MNTLHIVMPDWATNGGEFGISRPYGFWTVADQPMLYHWFDLAQESDYEKVVFHSKDADRLKEVCFDRECFWPVKCEFTDRKPPVETPGVDFNVVTVDSLNLAGKPLESPGIWEMIDHHWKLVTDRLEVLWLRYRDVAPGLPVGCGSKVHRTAKLIQPYWIGDGCEIGENCTVGPFACIGDRSRLEKGAVVKQTHLGPGSLIGADVNLTAHFVEEGVLFNREKQIRHRATDPLILLFDTGEPPPERGLVLPG